MFVCCHCNFQFQFRQGFVSPILSWQEGLCGEQRFQINKLYPRAPQTQTRPQVTRQFLIASPAPPPALSLSLTHPSAFPTVSSVSTPHMNTLACGCKLGTCHPPQYLHVLHTLCTQGWQGCLRGSWGPGDACRVCWPLVQASVRFSVSQCLYGWERLAQNPVAGVPKDSYGVPMADVQHDLSVGMSQKTY